MRIFRRFKHDNRAVVYAWVIVLVMMFTYAVVWFTAGWAAMKFVDTAEEQFDLGDRPAGIITLAKNVFAWHPVIVFIGYLLYAFVCSQRRDVRFDV